MNAFVEHLVDLVNGSELQRVGTAAAFEPRELVGKHLTSVEDRTYMGRVVAVKDNDLVMEDNYFITLFAIRKGFYDASDRPLEESR